MTLLNDAVDAMYEIAVGDKHVYDATGVPFTTSSWRFINQIDQCLQY